MLCVCMLVYANVCGVFPNVRLIIDVLRSISDAIQRYFLKPPKKNSILPFKSMSMFSHFTRFHPLVIHFEHRIIDMNVLFTLWMVYLNRTLNQSVNGNITFAAANLLKRNKHILHIFRFTFVNSSRRRIKKNGEEICRWIWAQPCVCVCVVVSSPAIAA